VSEMEQPKGDPSSLDGIGGRLREERVKAGYSQRELARRLGLSPSLISQLESGQSKPSVGTLYAIVTELGVSLDRVIRGNDFEAPEGDGGRLGSGAPVVHPGERAAIELDSGVRWEELTAEREEDVDFLEAIYEVGGASTPDQSLMRHHGREYGYIVSGTLGIQVGFQEYELNPGDSIAFDSTIPHRLFNKGDVPVHAIWFVVGRDSDLRSEQGPGGSSQLS
jgi:transcriptional regulator with XRE-family HTH domain